MLLADKMLAFPNCKAVLERWRDAPTTGLRTRATLETLVEKLKSYAQARRKRKAEQDQAEKQQNDLARAERQAQLGDEQRRLEMQRRMLAEPPETTS